MSITGGEGFASLLADGGALGFGRSVCGDGLPLRCSNRRPSSIPLSDDEVSHG